MLKTIGDLHPYNTEVGMRFRDKNSGAELEIIETNNEFVKVWVMMVNKETYTFCFDWAGNQFTNVNWELVGCPIEGFEI